MISKNESFTKQLLDWFESNKRDFSWRKPGLTPFQLLIAEIMLQKTGANQVENLFPVFIKKFPDAISIGKIKDEKLEEFLHPLGLFKRRARDIKKTAQQINENGNKVPRTRKELMELPGVGEYIANAVLCFALKKPVPIVDANVGRIMKRVFSFPVKSAPSRDKNLFEKMKEILPKKKARDFNLALLDFAALICLPRKPRCDECPLSQSCDFFSM
jgi:A/G-specific adenine glycosylase